MAADMHLTRDLLWADVRGDLSAKALRRIGTQHLMSLCATSDAAEKAFLEARDGFIAEGIGYDAAMVTVEDLALLYLREGRTADVKRLAEEILPIFQSQDVHREAVAALRLFQEAARQEQLTIQAVRDYVRYLRKARADPSRPFQPAEPG